MQDAAWSFGHRNMHVKQTYSELVLQELLTPLAPAQLHLHWPVARIEHAPGRITVTSTHGRILHADRAIITVPITVLQVYLSPISHHPTFRSATAMGRTV